MKQCVDCKTISTDADFKDGCPDCKSANTVEYDGFPVRCNECGYVGERSEFVVVNPHPYIKHELVDGLECPECKSEDVIELED